MFCFCGLGYLCFGKVGMSFFIWCIESEDNVFFGYFDFYKFISDVYFSLVFLNLDFIVFNIDMDYVVVCVF